MIKLRVHESDIDILTQSVHLTLSLYISRAVRYLVEKDTIEYVS